MESGGQIAAIQLLSPPWQQQASIDPRGDNYQLGVTVEWPRARSISMSTSTTTTIWFACKSGGGMRSSGACHPPLPVPTRVVGHRGLEQCRCVCDVTISSPRNHRRAFRARISRVDSIPIFSSLHPCCAVHAPLLACVCVRELMMMLI